MLVHGLDGCGVEQVLRMCHLAHARKRQPCAMCAGEPGPVGMSCHVTGYIGSLCWHVAAVLLTSARAMHAQVEELRGKTMGIVG